ncbi:hypothetical protein CN445_18585 [Bacillus cereus]|uniref:hypothetical protein n=1 Tax=Bacillus nitratireducens TaxID=2026193 RepID=UPI0005394F0F|nr:hypothetical protein [Bacillus nitratireducens]PEB83740.1 hypothetical protein COM95_00235 [Bacillus cereus]PEW85872.1 hypothetical protein CN445_18585 [Bacillus cereus]PFH79347.1 hypothetical protein COI61_08915 [Bacillus cereus]PFN64520.1 hypothetical protein COJ62_30065 [Bacillus cereus]SEB16806.1 hypothetical protein SAMN04488146_112116 [Bacillus nitratireducens]
MKKTKMRNYVKLFILYLIIVLIYFLLFDYSKVYIKEKINNEFLFQLYLLIGRISMGLGIYFIPEKLGIKIKFRFKFLIAVIAIITTITFLDIVGLIE